MHTNEQLTPERQAMKSLQLALQEFREKAVSAVRQIKELREYISLVETRNQELEQKLKEYLTMLDEKDAVIRQLQSSTLPHTAIDVGERLLYLSSDEREALERQINDLLLRINAHLG